MPYVAGAERIVAVTGGGYWPTLFRMTDGSLAAIVRGGSPHVGLNSRLDLIRSSDGGRTWSKSNVVPGSDKLDNRGSAAGQMPDGTIVVGYWESTEYRGAMFDTTVGGTAPFYVFSTDGGRTWSPKRPLPVAPLATGILFGRIVTLSDGTALMPLYAPMPKEETCWSALLRSRDNGRTWGDLTLIAREFNETSLLPLPDGRLLAFMRDDRSGYGSTWQSESTDLGRTWGKPRELTRSHQHPADACLLQSGRILLTYGNRVGSLAVGAMLSADGGRTWDWDRRVVLARHTLMLRGKTWGDCGYPSTVQLDDGTIVTIYYRLGHDQLPPDQQEKCLQYERDEFQNPPASEDMRRFEEAVCVRYTEADLS